jgi:hypothetical protein
MIPFSKGNYYLYILDIFSYPIITKWYTHTYISWTSYFFADNLRENEVTSLGPFSYTLHSKSFVIMSIFLIEHDLPLQITLWKCGLDWIFYFSNGFKVWEIMGGGEVVWGEGKQTFHSPIVLTSLFIGNLYMNPIIFNYPFSLLLRPFWF